MLFVRTWRKFLTIQIKTVTSFENIIPYDCAAWFEHIAYFHAYTKCADLAKNPPTRMFFTATDDKLGYIFFSTWLEKLSTRIWRSVILWLYESESLRLIIPVSSAAHVITSATMFPSSTQTLHRLLSDWDVLDYLVLIQFPRWQSIHCTQSRRDFTWTQIALICKYLPLTSIILLKVNWSKIYIITYRMHLKGALLPWFFFQSWIEFWNPFFSSKVSVQ